MATIYSAPSHIKQPSHSYQPGVDFKIQRENWAAADRQYLEELKAFCKSRNSVHPEVGEVIRFQVADGYAQYMIAGMGRKAELVHIPLGDAWDYHGIQHFSTKAIREELSRQKAFQNMLDKHAQLQREKLAAESQNPASC